jgi:Reverse transcriptase (RNA-dependent DNA polymerase)
LELKGVWKNVPISYIPHGRKFVRKRWVYTDKDDGTYRSRYVAKRFSQVPGKDFIESHTTVMTDLVFRLAIIIKVLKKLRTGQRENEIVFLFSELDEVIHMKVPDECHKYMLEVDKFI